MKVGTDSILLGAWTPLRQASRILDMGSGSGLISLMLAQRTQPHVQIVGIELDELAVKQSQENVRQSPWFQRIAIFQQDVRLYQPEALFDLIVSNPPYYTPGVACKDASREQARYTAFLTHNELLISAARFLSPQGRLCVILPVQEGEKLLEQADLHGWYTGLCVRVQDSDKHKPHRFLIELGRFPLLQQWQYLSLRDDQRAYTESFSELVKDFYLFL